MKIAAFKAYVFLVLIATSGCAQDEPLINGVSFVASRDQANQGHIDPVLEVNANYAAIMPFGFIRSINSPTIVYNTQRQWFGETSKGAKQYIELLNKNGIQVMLKPHIWISRGAFTGYMKMDSEANWKLLEEAYTQFIMDFAKLAEQSNVAVLCIGTELEQFVVNRPEYWKDLIAKIKAVYTGKLTYAANWDEYKRVPFWKELDFIGVDAYFPVANSKTPSITEAKTGWEPWKKELQSVSERENKKVLFTEFGYRSTNFAGKEPWNSDHNIQDINLEAQTNTTQALFESVWHESWFAGGFIWKWFINHDKAGGQEDSQFTPQNKPVEQVIKAQYTKQ